MTQGNILLIDDEKKKLQSLGDNISRHLAKERVEVVSWDPKAADLEGNKNIHQVIEGKLAVNPILVVVDYDLSNGGLEGLYSPTITHWCQKNLIPVIEYSRNHNGELPQMQNLFKFRAPVAESEIPKFVSDITKGFVQLKQSIDKIEEIHQKKYSEILFELFGKRGSSYDYTEYSNHLFKDSEFLYEYINDQTPDTEIIRQMSVYLLGHIIVNLIFRFPGPILSKDALCAFLAVNTSELPKLRELFGTAKYDGPFSELGEFYWNQKICDEIEKLFQELCRREKPNGLKTLRDIIERKEGREFADHGCKRCKGKNGGYFCPYNEIAVCANDDCSVAPSSFLPYGASVCRLSRDLFNKCKPILAGD